MNPPPHPANEKDADLLVKASFIGAGGERGDVLRDALNRVLDWHLDRRGSGTTGSAVTKPLAGLEDLLADLETSIPFEHLKYLAHQQSDPSIPALVGALIGLLTNANNVTVESGEATTEIELEVCDQILTMVGFPTTKHNRPGFAHLTGGGTIANMEALWAAREVMYLPLSIQAACIAGAHELQTPLKVDIRRCAPWRLLGLNPNQKLDLLRDFASVVQRSGAPNLAHEVEVRLRDTPRNRWNGYGDATAVYPPTVFVAETAHYSIEKATNLLGVGLDNVRFVETDHDLRLDVGALEASLDRAEAEGRVPMAVVPIAGTTQEGSIDPVERVMTLRKSRSAGEHTSGFWVHVDGAWGAYLRTLLPRRGVLPLRVRSAIRRIEDADSVTVDPHKMGYLPYPCGAIAFSDDRVRFLLRQHAPYIAKNDSADLVPPINAGESLGPYTLEGSRPSFPALALRMSNNSLPLDKGGVGQLARATVRRAQWLHGRLNGVDLDADWQLTSLQPAGPDSNLLVFAATCEGASAEQSNDAVGALFAALPPNATEPDQFRVSMTTYRAPQFGETTLRRLNRRRGICDTNASVKALRLSVLNPYFSTVDVATAETLGNELVAALQAVALPQPGPQSGT